MDHLERHPCLDERVIHAEHVIRRPIALCHAGVPGRRLLREQQRDAGQRHLVAQIALVLGVPQVDALDDGEPATVVQRAGELREPGAHAVGGSLGDPEPDLGLALHRVLPPIRLLEAHAEDPAHGPPPHHGAVLLAVTAVRPGRRHAAARLRIGELDLRKLVGRLQVGRTIRDDARVGIRRVNGRVPDPPQLDETRLAPLEKLSSCGIRAIGGRRQLQPGRRLEVALTVHAVALALRRPAIREDAVHAVPRHDLAMDLVMNSKL